MSKALLTRVRRKFGRDGYSFVHDGRLHFAQPHRHGRDQWWTVWRVKEGASIDDTNSSEMFK
jgi:signal transduction histidine kinase